MNRWLRTKSYGISTATKSNPSILFDRYWRRFGYVPIYVQETLREYYKWTPWTHPRYKKKLDGTWPGPPRYVYTALPWGEKVRCKYEKARDYSYAVCQRWARRYKQYLPVYVQKELRTKIEERFGWGAHINTKTHLLIQTEFEDRGIFEELCNVSLFKHVFCPFCERRAYLAYRYPIKPGWVNSGHDDKLPTADDLLNIGFEIMCYNPACRDMQVYLDKVQKRKNNFKKAHWINEYNATPDHDTQIALLTTAYVQYTAQTLLRQKNPVNNPETP